MAFLRFILAIGLWLAPILVFAAGGLLARGPVVLLVLAAVHIVGCYGLLHLSLRPEAAALKPRLRMILHLLIGAPLAAGVAASLVAMAGGEEFAVDGLYIYGIPALLVWPLLLATLKALPRPAADIQGQNGSKGASGGENPFL
ncbi:MAG: hypothetical protein JSR98_00490 [Proteobacteria bacterium]|nr:hypothetical protein [Pseudomonadota bacterium]